MHSIIYGVVLALIIALAVSFSLCDEEPKNISDTEILHARAYVADFDARTKEAQLQISNCPLDEGTQRMPKFRACKSSIYDSFGIKYNSKVEISNTVINEFNKYKKIALTPLTTEKAA